MTRNDYKIIADVIADMYGEGFGEGDLYTVRLVESRLARAFAKNNKGFDPIAFKEMCGF
jgi:hypothetical protein